MRRQLGQTTFIALVFLAIIASSARAEPDTKSAYSYDFSYTHFNGGLEEIASDWPRIYSSGRPVFKDDEANNVPDKKVQEGRAIVIQPYVLTLNHIIDLAYIEQPHGHITVSITAKEVREQEYYLSENKKSQNKTVLEKIIILPELDVALFKIPESSAITSTFPRFIFGKSNDLRVGNVLFLLGSPRLAGPVVRQGIIAALGKNLDQKIMDTLGTSLQNQDMIIISIGAIPGDSSSPIVALRKGVPEVIGLAHALLGNYLAAIIPIDSIFEKIKEKTGINLRKLAETNQKLGQAEK